MTQSDETGDKNCVTPYRLGSPDRLRDPLCQPPPGMSGQPPSPGPGRLLKLHGAAPRINHAVPPVRKAPVS
ncbi:hypothetical protein PGTUg99_033019 [Puccinia graminis f. sp. tritici]|nr:hypothetical protein PGTUg99_033019 [Puccinia graminis f. sp. tritici]